MAVTLTRADLARAIRVGDSAEELAELDRLLVMATEMVTNYVATAPDAIHNESVVRLIGYLYDAPTTARIGNPLRGSGAAAMLLAYRVMGVGYGDAMAEAQQAVGTAQNPVTGLAVLSGRLVVTFADGTTESLDLPAGMGDVGGVDQVARDAAADAAAELTAHAGLPNVHHTPTPPGGDGTDQTARDAASTAQLAADAAQTTADANATNQTDHDADPNAHHIPTTPSGEAVVNSARLPVGTVALRLGWAQSQTPTEAIFTRADNHPIDGAAVGTVAGTPIPVFPPALNTDTTLYLFIWIGTAIANIADIRLSGGGGTLIGSISNGAAYTLEGVAGTVYVTNQRLSAGTSAYQISAVVGGDLIASQPWVTEQIAAIPAGGGGGTITAILNGTLNTTRTQFAFPLAERQAVVAAWETYNALIFAFTDDNGGTVDYRTSRIPIVVPLLTSGAQLAFHFDYGSHGDTVDHDVRLLVLPSSSTISVAAAAGQTFQDGTTLIVYGEQ